jgi:hypothetical protein
MAARIAGRHSSRPQPPTGSCGAPAHRDEATHCDTGRIEKECQVNEGTRPRRAPGGNRLGLSPGVSTFAPDPAYVLSRGSVRLRSRPPPPEDEVGNWYDTGGADHHHHRRPHPPRASDLACWPPLEVDQRRKLEHAFGNCRDGDQPAGALAEVVPLSSGGHAILRIPRQRSRWPAPYIGLALPKLPYGAPPESNRRPHPHHRCAGGSQRRAPPHIPTHRRR